MLGIQAESPMVKTVLPLQGTWVQTLVGTKIPRATQHGKKKKKKNWLNIMFSYFFRK